ncbi:MAG: FkbM family methyltransferase [Phycisphaerales bacterium]
MRSFSGTTTDGVRRVWQNREVFADTRSWLLSARNAACIAFPGFPMPGRGSVRQVRTRDGQSYAVRLGASDLSVLYELERQHEYDGAVREFSDPGAVRCVVDMGANVGMSLRFWLRAFPRARVVGVEPDTGNVEMCRRNLALTPGGVERTDLVQACVGGQRRTVSLDRRRGAWGYRMSEGLGSEQIPVITVEDVLARAEGDVDLLKMDIEGAEAEVFAQPAPWLDRVHLLVIEVHAPFDEGRLRDALSRGPGAWSVTPMRVGAQASVYLAKRLRVSIARAQPVEAAGA